MINRVAIFGAGQRARELKRLLAIDGIALDYFVVDREYVTGSHFDKTPLISTEEFLDITTPENTALFLGVGMPKMNRIRERLFELFHSHGYEFSTYISPHATVLTKDIGEGNTIFAGVNIAPGVVIGDANHFEMGAIISHDCCIGDFNFFAPGCALCGDIKIGNGNFIGANSTLRNSITIEDYVLVGAGAYVDKDLSTGKVIVPQRSHILEDKTSEYFINK
ncbi:MAG: hypothetical protein IJO20_03410 [Ruminococcus sp.]|nr:hypothetical protein [Ruminococcus sp.]